MDIRMRKKCLEQTELMLKQIAFTFTKINLILLTFKSNCIANLIKRSCHYGGEEMQTLSETLAMLL